ncbi:sodium/hydrogen exchanger 9B2-like [Mizuhopecten yessoensis]|uniref:Mitochondrial sodium/hydrogen exchanger 9B2 n=1 Tax=Mizuhopecten yessoensis TaxID=6573 RepID=A0A210PMU4_MIZYE|nr:sodium/hydrogen exchanger 9B2-like [Mizuhopecten yessoensis]OWF37825.1 Mitochondrial sodium/hydrogen exchanger 9B2 [Mizuhopecten yessoensis]
MKKDMAMSDDAVCQDSNTEMDGVNESSLLRNKHRQSSDVESEIQTPKRCVGLRKCCHRFWKPMQTKNHQLPENPSIPQRLKYSLLCPPHGNLAWYIQFLILVGITWAVLVSLTHSEALPGGNFFSLFVLFYASVVGGYLVSFFRLPPLLGMLMVGAMLRNIPVVKIVGESISMPWSSALRQIALTVILIRAGLGLDPQALRKLSFTVLRLAFIPCLAECCAEAVAAHFLLGFPWEWGFMLGFVLAAVSPAVVVPSLLSLSDRGYGLDKGIPTLVIAAASVDDVLAITGFGVVLGISFSTGDIALTIVKGPLEAMLGVVYGIVFGIVLWYLPSKDTKNPTLYRSLLLLGAGLMATFGSSAVHLSGAGPLGCLTLAFVAALRWRKEAEKEGDNGIGDMVGLLWMIFQPLLFSLIGAAVDINTIDGGTVGLAMGTLAIGLFVRLCASFGAVLFSGLSVKEMLFIPIAWLPKATVQAAIGGIALDEATKRGDARLMALGTSVLTIAVLSIVITAPIGAALISIVGPMWLRKQEDNKDGIGDDNDEETKSMTEL